GSTIAFLPCAHFGSIGFSHGALIGRGQTRIRTPPSCFTRRLCALIHARTRWLTCHEALSHTNNSAFFPSACRHAQTQAKKSSVTWLTGRPATKRSSIPPPPPP